MRTNASFNLPSTPTCSSIWSPATFDTSQIAQTSAITAQPITSSQHSQSYNPTPQVTKSSATLNAATWYPLTAAISVAAAAALSSSTCSSATPSPAMAPYTNLSPYTTTTTAAAGSYHNLDYFGVGGGTMLQPKLEHGNLETTCGSNSNSSSSWLKGSVDKESQNSWLYTSSNNVPAAPAAAAAATTATTTMTATLTNWSSEASATSVTSPNTNIVLGGGTQQQMNKEKLC